LNVKVGIYIGNAAARSITGIGFKPEVVWLIEKETSGDEHGSMGFLTASAASVVLLQNLGSAPAFDAGLITMDSDGFTLTSSVKTNTLNTTYFFLCLSAGAGGDFKQGTYTGDGAGSKVINGLGFKPDFVFIRGDQTGLQAHYALKDMPAGAAKEFGGTGVHRFLIINTLDADGFTVGTSDASNKINTVYHYFALKVQAGVCDVGTYTGTGTPHMESLSDSNLTPDWMLTSFSFLAPSFPVIATVDTVATGLSIACKSTLETEDLTNGITALLTGGFNIGGNANVNRNTSAYFYIVLENNNEITPPTGVPPPTDRTETDLINDALSQIGAKRITLLSSGEPNANFALCFYATLRDDLLRLSHWRFATGRANLPQDATTPAFEFAFQYTLPADLIKLREYNGANTDRTNLVLFERSQPARFKIEGRKLLSNDGEVHIVYTKRITNPNKFDPMFFQALATWLASKLADAITKDRQKSDALMSQAVEILLPMAAAVDGQEGSVESYISDELLRGR